MTPEQFQKKQERAREWQIENKERLREYNRLFYLRNQEKAKERTRLWRKNHYDWAVNSVRSYKKRNRSVVTAAELARRRRDPLYRIRCQLRSRLWGALKSQGLRKSKKTMERIGCDLPFLRCWLELDFRDGMTWENYGKVWHIDHILPCASFDLSDPEQQKECFNYKNLQALPAKENLSKSASIPPIALLV